MAKDKNADKRHEYNLSILYAEQAYDELQAEKVQLDNLLVNLEDNLTQSFRRQAQLEEETIQMGGRGQSFSEVSERKQSFMRSLSEQRDELEGAYRVKLQSLDDEREQLQKERDKLSWE